MISCSQLWSCWHCRWSSLPPVSECVCEWGKVTRLVKYYEESTWFEKRYIMQDHLVWTKIAQQLPDGLLYNWVQTLMRQILMKFGFDIHEQWGSFSFTSGQNLTLCRAVVQYFVLMLHVHCMLLVLANVSMLTHVMCSFDIKIIT